MEADPQGRFAKTLEADVIEKRDSEYWFEMMIGGKPKCFTFPTREDGSADLGDGAAIAGREINASFTFSQTVEMTEEQKQLIEELREERYGVGPVAEGDEIVKGVDGDGNFILGRVGDEG